MIAEELDKIRDWVDTAGVDDHSLAVGYIGVARAVIPKLLDEIERMRDIVEWFAMYHPAEYDAALRVASIQASGRPMVKE